MSNKIVAVTFDLGEETNAAAETVLTAAAETRWINSMDPTGRQTALSESDAVLSFMMHNEIQAGEYEYLKDGCLLQTMLAGVDALPFDAIPDTVTICANTGAWADPMAEHILGMILALGKNFMYCHRKLAEGEFDRSISSTWFRGKTCGVIGYGGIGKAVARLLRPMGMKIMALNTSGKTGDDVAFIGSMDQLDHVLADSDVLVVALPLTKKTRDLIGARELSLMKEDAILINPARGRIIDQKALYQRLKDFPDFRAGIDAWWVEPFTHGEFRVDYPFFELDNLLGSPHNTNLVDGIYPEAAGAAARNVVAFLKGGAPRSIVDPEDYVV